MYNPHTFHNIIASAILLATAALLAACAAPQTQPLSKINTSPALHEDYFLANDGYRLPFLSTPETNTKAPSAVVIALHGFNDYSRAFEGMCNYLVDRSIACLAYDQRGFGATNHRGLWPQEGRLENDLQQLIELLSSKHPNTPIYLAGESMGGAVILSTMTRLPEHIKRSVQGLALFAPAVWGRDTQPWYQRWALALAVRIAPDWTPTGASLEIVATDNIEALRQMGRDELVIKETRIDAVYGLTNLMDKALKDARHINTKALIMYGEKDEVIPMEPTCTMLHSMNNANADYTFRLYPNGYHMLTRDLQAETVFSELYQWITTEHTTPSSTPIDALCEKA